MSHQGQINGFFSQLDSYVGAAFSSMTKYIQPAYKILSEFFSSTENQKGVIVGVLTAITGAVVALGITFVVSFAEPLLILGAIAAAGYLLATNWKYISPVVETVTNAVMNFVKIAGQQFQGFIKDHLAFFKNFLNDIQDLFTYSLNNIENWWKNNWQNMLQVATGIWDIIKAAFESFLGILEVVWGVFEGLFTGNWTKAWTDIKTGFEDIWNGIKDFFIGIWDVILGILKMNINNFIDQIDGTIDRVNGAGTKVGIPKIPDIPHLAAGTNYFQGGWAVVGEQGRELVNLPTGSQVIPNNQTTKMTNNNGVTINQDIKVYNQTDLMAAAKMMGLQVAMATH